MGCRSGKPKQEEPPVKILVSRASSRRQAPTHDTEDIRKREQEIKEFRELLTRTKVEVKRSTIRGAGRGLFACERIPAKAPIVEYTGELITHGEAKYRRKQGHASHIRSLLPMTWCIDGIDESTGGAMANDGKHMNNAEMVAFHTKDNVFLRNPNHSLVYLRALRVIEEGEEIFVSYGEDYEWPEEIVDDLFG
jgi:SET domain-containing protein